ncbi:MAG: alpha/beta fold hydrolase, partial [Solirubrobacteraceae bacterium]
MPASPRVDASLLVLSGAGLDAAIAERIVRALEPHFAVVPARGGGSSPQSATAVMSAAEAIEALDCAGVEQAHVVGLSFGGVIAQELAIEFPDRVRSLVLGSTSAGGRLDTPPEPPVALFLRDLGDRPAEEGLWAAVPYLYSAFTRRSHPQRIGEDIERRLATPVDVAARGREQAAARSHDAADRLDRISAPTLVVHGEQDRITPLDNARGLASGIPDARLLALPESGHAFPTDCPE